MSPDEIDDRISSGFEDLATAAPEPGRVRDISREIASSLKPVRALPSNIALVLICLAGFAALAILLTMPVGYAGFERLDPGRRLILYPAVLIAVAPLAAAIVSAMIPGSRLRVPVAVAILFALVAMGGLTLLLFPEFGLARFVQDGVPCLRLGTICAVPAGVFVFAFMRWGFIIDPVPAALTASALSGCVGVGVLTLHCPIQNTPHILTWHLGVILVAVVIAAVFAGCFRHQERVMMDTISPRD